MEPNIGEESVWPAMAVFSYANLSLAHVGQYNFIAIDRMAREAVGFFEERTIKDDRQFSLLLAALCERTVADPSDSALV